LYSLCSPGNKALFENYLLYLKITTFALSISTFFMKKKIKNEQFSDNPGFLTEKLRYSQICGTKVDP